MCVCGRDMCSECVCLCVCEREREWMSGCVMAFKSSCCFFGVVVVVLMIVFIMLNTLCYFDMKRAL